MLRPRRTKRKTRGMRKSRRRKRRRGGRAANTPLVDSRPNAVELIDFRVSVIVTN